MHGRLYQHEYTSEPLYRDAKPLLSLRMPTTPDFEIDDSLDSASSIPTLDAFPETRNFSVHDMEHTKSFGGDGVSDVDRLKRDFEELANVMMGWMERGRKVLGDIEEANRKSIKATPMSEFKTHSTSPAESVDAKRLTDLEDKVRRLEAIIATLVNASGNTPNDQHHHGAIVQDAARTNRAEGKDIDGHVIGSSGLCPPAYSPEHRATRSTISHVPAPIDPVEPPRPATLSVPADFAGPSTFLSPHGSSKPSTLSSKLTQTLGRKRSSSILSSTHASPSGLGLKSSKAIANIRAISYSLGTTSPALALEPATPAGFQYDPEFMKRLTEGLEAKDSVDGSGNGEEQEGLAESGEDESEDQFVKTPRLSKIDQAVASESTSAIAVELAPLPIIAIFGKADSETSNTVMVTEPVQDVPEIKNAQGDSVPDSAAASTIGEVESNGAMPKDDDDADKTDSAKMVASPSDEPAAIAQDDATKAAPLVPSTAPAIAADACGGCGRPEHAQEQVQTEEAPVTTAISTPVSTSISEVSATDLLAAADIVTDVSTTASASNQVALAQPAAGPSRQPVPSSRPSLMSTLKTTDEKWKYLFNHLNAKNLDSTAKMIIDSINRNVDEQRYKHVRLIVQLLFEKVMDERDTSKICASVALKVWGEISPYVKDATSSGTPCSGSNLFQRYMLARCAYDFRKELKRDFNVPPAVSGLATATSAAVNSTAGTGVAPQSASVTDVASDTENTILETGNKGKEVDRSYQETPEAASLRRRISLLTFVGELYNTEIITTRLLDGCIIHLLSDKAGEIDQGNLEALCRMLPIVGTKLEAQFEMGKQMQHHMHRLKLLVQSGELSPRVRTVVKDVMDLHSRQWQPKVVVPAKPKAKGRKPMRRRR